MEKFDPGKAIFGVLTAKLSDNPEETTFSYVNPSGLNLFGENLLGRKVLNTLEDLLNSADSAQKTFKKLLSEETIIIEGTLNGKYVQYHSMFDKKSGYLQAAIMDTTENRRAQEGFEYTTGALSRAAEANDEDTGHHIVRINYYSGKLAWLLGLNKQFVDNISLLAQLHDVGKIHINPNILKKPDKLTDNEFEEMKQHTIYGAKIIGDHPRLALARQIALGHHEKYGGTGYPHNLSGEMIPLSARIVAIVDVFDALVSARPYKPSFDYDKTYRIMTEGDNRTDPKIHFDPKILKTFIENYHLFTQIHKDLKG